VIALDPLWLHTVTARLKTTISFFCKLHGAATGLYSAVEYVRRMLPTFKPAEEKDRRMIEQVILPYLDRQLKAADE
jgi:hypothetical protein